MYHGMYHNWLSAVVQEFRCAEKRQDDNFFILLEKIRLLTDLSTSSGDNLNVKCSCGTFGWIMLVRC